MSETMAEKRARIMKEREEKKKAEEEEARKKAEAKRKRAEAKRKREEEQRELDRLNNSNSNVAITDNSGDIEELKQRLAELEALVGNIQLPSPIEDQITEEKIENFPKICRTLKPEDYSVSTGSIIKQLKDHRKDTTFQSALRLFLLLDKKGLLEGE